MYISINCANYLYRFPYKLLKKKILQVIEYTIINSQDDVLNGTQIILRSKIGYIS